MNSAYSTKQVEHVTQLLQNCSKGELDEALEFWDNLTDAKELLKDPELIAYAEAICKVIRQLRRIAQIIEDYSESRNRISAAEVQ